MKRYLPHFCLFALAFSLLFTTGCGGKKEPDAAAVKVFFCDGMTSMEHPNMTYYLSLLDENGKSVYQTSVITDEKGMGVFDGLPTSGKYVMRLWNVQDHQCELPVDLSQFTGPNRGNLLDRCVQW